VRPHNRYALVVLIALAGACSKPHGTIAGRLYQVGGPYPGLPTPVPGIVSVPGHGSVSAGPDGSFSIDVPPGTYTLNGTFGENNPCAARRAVTVLEDAVARVDVICDIP
jgi:hypothetical protein